MRPTHPADTTGIRLSAKAVSIVCDWIAERNSTDAIAKSLRTTKGTLADAITGRRMQRGTIERLEAAIVAEVKRRAAA